MNQKTGLGGDIPMPEEKLDEKEAEEAEDLTFYPYLKRKLNLHIVHDTSIYQSRMSVAPQL